MGGARIGFDVGTNLSNGKAPPIMYRIGNPEGGTSVLHGGPSSRRFMVVIPEFSRSSTDWSFRFLAALHCLLMIDCARDVIQLGYIKLDISCRVGELVGFGGVRCFGLHICVSG